MFAQNNPIQPVQSWPGLFGQPSTMRTFNCNICKLPFNFTLSTPIIISPGIIKFPNQQYFLLNINMQEDRVNNLVLDELFQVICLQCFKINKFYDEFERLHPKYQIYRSQYQQNVNEINQLKLLIQEKDQLIKKLQKHQNKIQLNPKNMNELQNIPFLDVYQRLMDQQIQQKFVRLQKVFDSFKMFNHQVLIQYQKMKQNFQRQIQKIRKYAILNVIGLLSQDIKQTLLAKNTKLEGRIKFKQSQMKMAKQCFDSISIFNDEELNENETFLNQYINFTIKQIKQIELIQKEAQKLTQTFQEKEALQNNLPQQKNQSNSNFIYIKEDVNEENQIKDGDKEENQIKYEDKEENQIKEEDKEENQIKEEDKEEKEANE